MREVLGSNITLFTVDRNKLLVIFSLIINIYTHPVSRKARPHGECRAVRSSDGVNSPSHDPDLGQMSSRDFVRLSGRHGADPLSYELT